MGQNSTTALLWIGSPEQTRKAVCEYIRRIVARCKGCNTCYFCTFLARNSEGSKQVMNTPPLVVWLRPKEHGYLRDYIDEGLRALDVALDTHEQSACVIESIDQLNSATANRLLKIVEEPPIGWHILFTTYYPSEVLPTLRSRCLEYKIEEGPPDSRSTLQPSAAVLTWLRDPQPSLWLAVCAAKDDLPRAVPEITYEMHRLIEYWHDQWRSGSDPRAAALLGVLTPIMAELPAPGGAVGFWRTLLLRVARALHESSTTPFPL